jgi:hypothetical protein
MFNFFQNRVYTEKPFLFPTHELFDRFYNEYFITHPAIKTLSYFEFGLCGRFLRDLTWDIDIRLMGKPKKCDYEIIADFLRDIIDTGLNKYRIKIDIDCMETPGSIEEYNKGFNSNMKYLYLTTYVDHLKQYIRFDERYFKTTDRTNRKITQVSENLWRLDWRYELSKYRIKYLNGVVPEMIKLSNYKGLI